uniref:ABC-type glutathione-S-conjugate transporter n=1 Tax=Tetranychus urticae TaxID=32264 RepID=T1KCV0_TETUR
MVEVAVDDAVYFETLCHENIFWSNNQTWNTTSPKLSRCFSQTVLNWLPTGLLWLFTIIKQLVKSDTCVKETQKIPWNLQNSSRFILTLICILLYVLQLSKTIYQHSYSPESIIPVDFLAPILNIVSFIFVLTLFHYHRLHGVHTSVTIWIYIFLQTITSFITSFQTWTYPEDYSPFDINLFNTQSVVIFLLLFVISFADVPNPPLEDHSETGAQKDSYGINPETKASFPNHLFFLWFSPLAWLGWRKILTTKDLWDLRDDMKTKNLIQVFESSAEKKTFHENKTPNVKQLQSDEQELSVIPVFIKIFGYRFLVGSFLKLLHDTAQFIVPQLLKYLIDFIEKQSDEPVWHGYAIVVALFLASIVQTISINHYFYRMYIIGMKVSSTLTAVIYKKSLKLGNEIGKEITSGEKVNLLSVDARKFMDFLPFVNLIWSIPLQIGVAIYFLYIELGYSSFFGLLIMITMLPINAIMVRIGQKFQIKSMEQKDSRVKFMNEVLSGIKIIKFYAWEEPFLQNVIALRKKELDHLESLSFLHCVSIFLWSCSTTIVSVVTFATFILVQGETLTAQKAFVSLSLFNILRFPLTMIPNVTSLYISTSVSIKRINEFLSANELEPYVTRNDRPDFAVTVEDGYFMWNQVISEDERSEHKERKAFGSITDKDHETYKLLSESNLKQINMKIEQGKLVAIIGPVGSGKSSLLHAILGEMKKVKGRVNIDGKLKMAFVAQQVWIQNTTLRENILFGNPYIKSKYDRVISACALDLDISYLPGGDETEIGEKGINLSGGQKQRVSLARACYSDSDLYIMDDPLSAVDAHVSAHIFENVFSSESGLLKDKTRIVVINRLDLLTKVDQIYILNNGMIRETGTYKELMKSEIRFVEYVEELSQGTSTSQNNQQFEAKDVNIQNDDDLDERHKLIRQETTETGTVKSVVYFEYFKMVTFLWTFLIIASHFVMEGFELASNVWLSEWSDLDTKEKAVNDSILVNAKMGIGIYSVLGLAKGIVTFIVSWTLVIGTSKASVGFHRDLLFHVFHAPISFFDSNPLGRILNRFSKDMDSIDTTLPQALTCLGCFFGIAASFIILFVKTPTFIATFIPIFIVYGFVQVIYMATSRQLKRLESISRSPIYTHFGETLSGFSTIRAFDVSEQFMEESAKKVDLNISCLYLSVTLNRWLSTRLEFFGILITLSTTIFAVIARDSLEPGLVGLVVSYSILLTGKLSWFVRTASDFETNIVSVERILEYCKISNEEDWYKGKIDPEDDWPSKGTITFDKYEARYQFGSELIIKGISANIKSKEKVGIVGRTGAGKSTLTLALFRLIEPSGGKIYIDDYDICDLPLSKLRSRLAIIPQDPVLFGGSLRFNLDPVNQYTSNEIWTALSHVQLADFIAANGGLNFKITEEGKKLSCGQRQLICLARALLKKPKILVLDEATAAIDLETDNLIQKAIRSQFGECTILTIAHRLNTILDSDRVMVLDAGQIIEFDEPRNLLNNKDSLFYSLAKEANLIKPTV